MENKILNDEWNIKLNELPPSKLEYEYGSAIPIRFWKPKCYDIKGNEIEIPVCEKCQISKSQLIGKESFMWTCTVCGE